MDFNALVHRRLRAWTSPVSMGCYPNTKARGCKALEVQPIRDRLVARTSIIHCSRG